MKTILLILAFFVSEVYAQRDRPSSGRSSSRSGSSSYSSGSSSSTVSSGSWSSSSSDSSSDDSSYSSSSSSSSGGSSDWGGYSDYDSSPYYTPQEYTQRARKRLRGRNTAPILKHRYQEKRLVRSGNISGVRHYHDGAYSQRHHIVYSGPMCASSIYYSSAYSYHVTVSSGYIYNSWLMEPSLFYYSPGFHCIGNYPYYVDNGYQHRYSDVDICNYELVNLEDDSVIKTYHNMACKKGFDQCAAKRDQLNAEENSHQYVCVERASDEVASDKQDKIPALINHLTDAEIAETKLFLEMNDEKSLYKMAANEGIRKCKVVKTKKSKNKCNYLVTVGDKIYPMTDGSICSNSKETQLKRYGCNFASQRKNAVCLLSLAIAEGYCSKSAELKSKYY